MYADRCLETSAYTFAADAHTWLTGCPESVPAANKVAHPRSIPMNRRTLLALALVAGFASANQAVAGPFFNRPTPPSAVELGLDAAQTAEWQAIQADAMALRQDTLMHVKLELAQTRESLAEPDADLRAIGQDYQSIALTALMEQRQLRERRLAFYNGLNPQQQAEVREFLIDVTERAERAIRAFEVLQGEG